MNSEPLIKSDSVEAFAVPIPTGVVPVQFSPDPYTDTKRHRDIETKSNSQWGGVCFNSCLPESHEPHLLVYSGRNDCLWRLCRKIAAQEIEHGQIFKDTETEEIFSGWYSWYTAWCDSRDETPEPHSRLYGYFCDKRAKCLLPEGAKLISLAFSMAKQEDPPKEAESFSDDPKMSLLVAVLWQMAQLNSKGGFFYVSCRDIADTGLCNKDTVPSWLRTLEAKKILIRISTGTKGSHGKASSFVYSSLLNKEKLPHVVRLQLEQVTSMPVRLSAVAARGYQINLARTAPPASIPKA